MNSLLLTVLAIALTPLLITNIISLLVIRNLTQTMSYQQSIYDKNLLDAAKENRRSLEQLFRARASSLRTNQSHTKLRKSPTPDPDDPTPTPSNEPGRAEFVKDPDHPDRDFLG